MRSSPVDRPRDPPQPGEPRRPASSADDTWRERGGDAPSLYSTDVVVRCRGQVDTHHRATGALGSVAARALSEADCAAPPSPAAIRRG